MRIEYRVGGWAARSRIVRRGVWGEEDLLRPSPPSLIWRRHHEDGKPCLEDVKNHRPASLAHLGEKIRALGPCGCGAGRGYYLAVLADADTGAGRHPPARPRRE